MTHAQYSLLLSSPLNPNKVRDRRKNVRITQKVDIFFSLANDAMHLLTVRRQASRLLLSFTVVVIQRASLIVRELDFLRMVYLRISYVISMDKEEISEEEIARVSKDRFYI